MSNEAKRFIIRAIIFIFTLVLLIYVYIKATEPKAEDWEYHTAQYGDNLWNIAKEYNPEYEGDLRKVMYYIKQANGMKSDTVYVGHVYEVPVME